MRSCLTGLTSPNSQTLRNSPFSFLNARSELLARQQGRLSLTGDGLSCSVCFVATASSHPDLETYKRFLSHAIHLQDPRPNQEAAERQTCNLACSTGVSRQSRQKPAPQDSSLRLELIQPERHLHRPGLSATLGLFDAQITTSIQFPAFGSMGGQQANHVCFSADHAIGASVSF